MAHEDRSQGLHGRPQPVGKRSGQIDAYLFEHHVRGSERNYTNYCNPGIEKICERQSIEPDQTKRKHLIREIDRQLPEDAARLMCQPGEQ